MQTILPYEGDVFLGDATDLMVAIPDNSIDLIVTDPPYPRKYAEPCFMILAEHSKRILKRGGSLVSIIPHYLDEWVKVTMWKYANLVWRWPFRMTQDVGPHPRMAMGIEVTWKPVGWWVQGAYPQGRGYVSDNIPIMRPPKKRYHKWEQSTEYTDYIIRKLTNPGDVVLDPFAGGGTTGISAINLERRYILGDNDPRAVEVAQERLHRRELEKSAQTAMF